MISGHAFGRHDRRRALLPFEPVVLIAQPLVLRPQRRDLGRLRLDHVEQQAQDAPGLRVRDPTQIHIVQHPGPTLRHAYFVTPVYCP